mmetsp:Transcript_1702/g.5137  ORF Transcript_1702/g.5137 Transcript_1702/m.5137 type:complete len:190 (-) Transcript_1702:3046-3615(-)
MEAVLPSRRRAHSFRNSGTATFLSTGDNLCTMLNAAPGPCFCTSSAAFCTVAMASPQSTTRQRMALNSLLVSRAPTLPPPSPGDEEQLENVLKLPPVAGPGQAQRGRALRDRGDAPRNQKCPNVVPRRCVLSVSAERHGRCFWWGYGGGEGGGCSDGRVASTDGASKVQADESGLPREGALEPTERWQF